jgi:hypothetical protein
MLEELPQEARLAASRPTPTYPSLFFTAAPPVWRKRRHDQSTALRHNFMGSSIRQHASMLAA